MREYEPQFRDAGAQLAAIGLGDRNYAAAFQEELGITFPLLIDEEREAYQAAGLRSANLFHMLRVDNALRHMGAKAGGHSQKRLGQNPFQLGGSFVFAPENRDVFAHLSKTFGDNASPAFLLKAAKGARQSG